MNAYKILTHDYRPPVQGGKPIWDGTTLPYTLPRMVLDKSDAECACGWNYVTDLAVGFRIAGLWSTGRPSTVLVVEPQGQTVTRGDKSRAEGLTLLRVASEEEIATGIRALSAPFGVHAERMAQSQLAWREALARPLCDAVRVEAELHKALTARRLSAWTVKRFGTIRNAKDTRNAWIAKDAWAAGIARDAWNDKAVRDAWNAKAAWEAWAAWDAWVPWIAGVAWDTWDARDAKAALSVEFTALRQWIKYDPDILTAGIREAYRYGLEIAVPIGPMTLGWIMA